MNEIDKYLLTPEEKTKLSEDYPLLDFSFEDDYTEEVALLLQAQVQKVLDKLATDPELIAEILDTIGFYPKAVIRGGIETKRTKWQDGWNAALIEIGKRIAERERKANE